MFLTAWNYKISGKGMAFLLPVLVIYLLYTKRSAGGGGAFKNIYPSPIWTRHSYPFLPLSIPTGLSWAEKNGGMQPFALLGA